MLYYKTNNPVELKRLISDETKTSDVKVIFNFGIWQRHMKTENSNIGTRELLIFFCVKNGMKGAQNRPFHSFWHYTWGGQTQKKLE